jgi:hypothetical protein
LARLAAICLSVAMGHLLCLNWSVVDLRPA